MDSVKLPTIPPWEAATQLRLGIKTALKNWSGPSASAEKMISFEGFQKRRADIVTWWNSHLERRQITDQRVTKLTAAIERRRVSEMRGALLDLRMAVTQERTYADKAMNRLFGYAPTTYPNGGNGGGVSKQSLEVWNQLAQCLPTVEGLPQDALEMVVRAIVAILRANNIEGIEGVTHITAGVLNQNGGANGNSTTGASPPGEEVFADEAGDADGDDDAF